MAQQLHANADTELFLKWTLTIENSLKSNAYAREAIPKLQTLHAFVATQSTAHLTHLIEYITKLVTEFSRAIYEHFTEDIIGLTPLALALNNIEELRTGTLIDCNYQIITLAILLETLGEIVGDQLFYIFVAMPVAFKRLDNGIASFGAPWRARVGIRDPALRGPKKLLQARAPVLPMSQYQILSSHPEIRRTTLLRRVLIQRGCYKQVELP